jgi:hypothetical protein
MLLPVNEANIGGSQCFVAGASPFVRSWEVGIVRI